MNNNNLDVLMEAGKAAITARTQLEQRIAENQENWTRTSDFVKDIWNSLELSPRKFKVGQATFTCDKDGITQEPQFTSARDPKTLGELHDLIRDFLDRVRLGYDEKMQP